MHTARRTKRSFTGETQPRTSNHFSVMLFRKTRLLSRRRICIPQGARNAVLREKLSPNLKSFFGDVFFARQGFQAAAVYAYRKTQGTKFYGKNSARTSNHFSVIFFRKTRKISADVQAYFKRNLTQYSGNSARTSNHFSVMFFRKTRLLSRRCIIHTARRKKRRIAEKQPEKSDFHNVGFLFLCHIVNFFNVFVGYLLNLVLTVVELVFGYGFIFVEFL